MDDINFEELSFQDGYSDNMFGKTLDNKIFEYTAIFNQSQKATADYQKAMAMFCQYCIGWMTANVERTQEQKAKAEVPDS